MKKIVVLMMIFLASLSSPLFAQPAADNQEDVANSVADERSLQQRISELETQNRDLKANVDDLEDRVTDLEERITNS